MIDKKFDAMVYFDYDTQYFQRSYTADIWHAKKQIF